MENIFDYETRAHKFIRDTVASLHQPAFDDVYSEEVFNNLKMELEVLEDQGKDLGKQLRKVAEETTRVRDQLEEQCHEVWGHTFEDGICTNCTKVEEPDENAWAEIQSGWERE